MTDLSIANTILQQLGGAGRLRAMIGAKSFIGGDKSLTVRFPQAKDRINAEATEEEALRGLDLSDPDDDLD